MDIAIHDVADFHRATGTPVLTRPRFVEERAELRANLITEEYDETMDAIMTGDMVEIADGLADLIYVCIGTALEFGIPLDKVWEEVHNSNMAKIDPATGMVRHRADGKVIKPDGWKPPDIKAILEAA